ncbi:Gag-Pro-Pol polyprotein, partial [Trachymyrmex zeteki]
GKLLHFLLQWRQLISDSMILESILDYRLSFTRHSPPQVVEPSVRLSESEKSNCFQEIIKLHSKGTIEPVTDCESQFLSTFFLIEKPSGGWRFILNLKILNEFIIAPHFKLEDWKTVIRILSPGDFLASIDLEDAYFFIPIHEDDRKFLRFRFQDRLFQFRALPFGLAFSVVYLDDFLLIGSS